MNPGKEQDGPDLESAAGAEADDHATASVTATAIPVPDDNVVLSPEEIYAILIQNTELLAQHGLTPKDVIAVMTAGESDENETEASGGTGSKVIEQGSPAAEDSGNQPTLSLKADSNDIYSYDIKIQRIAKRIFDQKATSIDTKEIAADKSSAVVEQDVKNAIAKKIKEFLEAYLFNHIISINDISAKIKTLENFYNPIDDEAVKKWFDAELEKKLAQKPPLPLAQFKEVQSFFKEIYGHSHMCLDAHIRDVEKALKRSGHKALAIVDPKEEERRLLEEEREKRNSKAKEAAENKRKERLDAKEKERLELEKNEKAQQAELELKRLKWLKEKRRSEEERKKLQAEREAKGKERAEQERAEEELQAKVVAEAEAHERTVFKQRLEAVKAQNMTPASSGEILSDIVELAIANAARIAADSRYREALKAADNAFENRAADSNSSGDGKENFEVGTKCVTRENPLVVSTQQPAVGVEDKKDLDILNNGIPQIKALSVKKQPGDIFKLCMQALRNMFERIDKLSDQDLKDIVLAGNNFFKNQSPSDEEKRELQKYIAIAASVLLHRSTSFETYAPPVPFNPIRVAPKAMVLPATLQMSLTANRPTVTALALAGGVLDWVWSFNPWAAKSLATSPVADKKVMPVTAQIQPSIVNAKSAEDKFYESNFTRKTVWDTLPYRLEHAIGVEVWDGVWVKLAQSLLVELGHCYYNRINAEHVLELLDKVEKLQNKFSLVDMQNAAIVAESFAQLHASQKEVLHAVRYKFEMQTLLLQYSARNFAGITLAISRVVDVLKSLSKANLTDEQLSLTMIFLDFVFPIVKSELGEWLASNLDHKVFNELKGVCTSIFKHHKAEKWLQEYIDIAALPALYTRLNKLLANKIIIKLNSNYDKDTLDNAREAIKDAASLVNYLPIARLREVGSIAMKLRRIDIREHGASWAAYEKIAKKEVDRRLMEVLSVKLYEEFLTMFNQDKIKLALLGSNKDVIINHLKTYQYDSLSERGMKAKLLEAIRSCEENTWPALKGKFDLAVSPCRELVLSTPVTRAKAGALAIDKKVGDKNPGWFGSILLKWGEDNKDAKGLIDSITDAFNQGNSEENLVILQSKVGTLWQSLSNLGSYWKSTGVVVNSSQLARPTAAATARSSPTSNQARLNDVRLQAATAAYVRTATVAMPKGVSTHNSALGFAMHDLPENLMRHYTNNGNGKANSK